MHHHPAPRTTWFLPTKQEQLPVSLTALSKDAAVQQIFVSGEEGTKLIAWSNPPAQPQSPFIGRTVFIFHKDLFDDVAALASGPASIENPSPDSGEGGSGNRDGKSSEPESGFAFQD